VGAACVVRRARGRLRPSREDAAYFAAWVQRVLADAEARDDYNTMAEREATLAYLRRALEGYRGLMRAGSKAR